MDRKKSDRHTDEIRIWVARDIRGRHGESRCTPDCWLRALKRSSSSTSECAPMIVKTKRYPRRHMSARARGGGCTHVLHGRSRMTINHCITTMPGLSTSGFHIKPGLFEGQVKLHGSGRVGSADPTRPAKKLRCVDLTRPDPRDFETLLTRPDPTREI